MKAVLISVVMVVVIFGPISAKMNCAKTVFDGSTSDDGVVWCGSGYHQCANFKEACCSYVTATPVQVTLVVMGPVAIVTSLILVFFVIKTAIGVIREDMQASSSYPKHIISPAQM